MERHLLSPLQLREQCPGNPDWILQADSLVKAEASSLSFDGARTQSKKVWNEYLGRIAVEGKKKEDLVKFYTGLYHAVLGRGLASDVNGAYPKNNGTVGQIPLGKGGKPLHHHYNTDAIWGGYWNLTQLWALAYPEYYSDFIKSLFVNYGIDEVREILSSAHFERLDILLHGFFQLFPE